jgi:uroporphyrinogen-III decarboxylase
MVKSAKELYAERQKRINDAIALKEPDRVPISPGENGWCFKYAGLSWIDGLYDPEKALQAHKKTVIELNWDAFGLPWGSGVMFPVKGFDKLDIQQLMWPGAEKEENRIKANITYQFVEPGSRGKYDPMPAEDYDVFLDDPSDYLIRRWWPRIAKNLEPLKNISPLHLANSVYGFGPLFGSPDFIKALKVLLEASEEYSKSMALLGPFVMEMVQLGFPPSGLSFTVSPYDYLADNMRGTEGCMIDMFRRPEKLKEAIKKVTPYCIEMGLGSARQFKDLSKIVFIPVHKGAGGFMSNEQYEEFWWPSMREVMIALINEGFIPYLYSEGIYTDRLPIIKDIPKGKAIYHIESDIFKAKKILGDTVCLTGGPTASLLNTGTPKQVEEYTKRLIDEVGQGGGFMMDVEVPLITAKIENVEAMTKTVMEYGVY